jgi:hypothetical protein
VTPDAEPAPPEPRVVGSWRARAQQPLWRRALPFVLAAALLTFVVARLDLDAFRAAIGRLDVASFLGFTVVWVVALLAADSLGSVASYRVSVKGVRFGQFYVLRGASYLPGLVNHHLGQAFLTYMTSRAFDVPLARVAGATLLSYAGWMGCLLGLAMVALPVAGMPWAWLLAPLGAGIVYLIVLHLRPARLARIGFLAPLFEAGLAGHAIALFARIPHLGVLVLGTWLPFFFFDVSIPVGPALLFIPIVLVAVTLPLTPQGFGTRDALCVAFFSTFASGATDAERTAQIAACTTSWGVAAALVSALVGLVCTRFAARLVDRQG